MNKIFGAFMLLTVTSVSQAAFVACSPSQSNVVTNSTGQSTPFTCSPGGSGASANIDGDGLTITSIRLLLAGTFQNSQVGVVPEGTEFAVSFTSVNSGQTLATGSFTLGGVACNASALTNAAGNADGGCFYFSPTVAVSGLPDSIPEFIVTVTGGPGSNPLPFTASASVAYEVETVPGVPEPATYAMMGMGIVGAYIARRRRA